MITMVMRVRRMTVEGLKVEGLGLQAAGCKNIKVEGRSDELAQHPPKASVP